MSTFRSARFKAKISAVLLKLAQIQTTDFVRVESVYKRKCAGVYIYQSASARQASSYALNEMPSSTGKKLGETCESLRVWYIKIVVRFVIHPKRSSRPFPPWLPLLFVEANGRLLGTAFCPHMPWLAFCCCKLARFGPVPFCAALFLMPALVDAVDQRDPNASFPLAAAGALAVDKFDDKPGRAVDGFEVDEGEAAGAVGACTEVK